MKRLTNALRRYWYRKHPSCQGEPLRPGDWVYHIVIRSGSPPYKRLLQVAYFSEHLVHFTDRTHAKKEPNMDWLFRVQVPEVRRRVR